MEIIKTEHNTEENALIVENYPYGFKRTKKKYWIETTKKGDRLITQTLNPKTNKWNKPKKETYTDVKVLVKLDNGHIKTKSWGCAYSKEEDLNDFLEFIGDYPLNDLQKEKIKIGKAVYKVRKGIKYEIRIRKFKNIKTGEIVESIPCFEMSNYIEVDDNGNEINKEEELKEEKQQKENINKAFNYEYSKL